MLDRDALRDTLLDLLAIPSPSGFTDEIIRYIARRLSEMDVEFDITRRGTVRARMPGDAGDSEPAQAVVCHVDTIGAMVRSVKPTGRMLVAPIGYWSSRFAEGARVTLFTEHKAYRGTLLPDVSWGVSRDAGVGEAPGGWENIELRLDEPVTNPDMVRALGIDVGDFIALDTQAEVLPNGFIVGRNLDNKAGAAAVLETIRHFATEKLTPSRDTYFLFTVTETVGSGAGSAILPEVSELVTVDFAAEPWAERSPFEHLTIASGDASGPYDWHLTNHLNELATEHNIPFERRVLPAHHSDAAAALAAGHDVRTAVVAYAADASHSMERTHFGSLDNLAGLLACYMQSAPTFAQDTMTTTVSDFSHQIDADNLPDSRTDGPRPAEVIKRNR
ncbi:MAG: osmoprotectant NAGGN system M42 family peptidase [Halieaceae bacterium]|jgi:peptidase M42 family hydrolase|nr:osmoprotectant NAGGN system M42 family peptidase [Halieaceae bacterium]